MTRAVLADDETHLLDHLRHQLATAWPELEIVATAHNGDEALRHILEQRPDVAFLDIRMPGRTGLEVARAVAPDTRVVFVTAFDQYAVEAFTTSAVDYLVKPVTMDRLLDCVRRLRTMPAIAADELRRLLDQLQSAPTPARLDWLRVGAGDTTRLVAVDEVLYFRADNKYTTAVTADREHLLRLTIRDLEEGLDDKQFWRIHRGIIVNASAVEDARRDLRGRYVLRIHGRRETLRTSEAYAHLFRHM
ncbi:MAG: LytTR family DNA-binding domain-containing protein [Pseudomonadales bacterium]